MHKVKRAYTVIENDRSILGVPSEKLTKALRKLKFHQGHQQSN